MRFITLLVALFSFSALAGPQWNDLEIDMSYKLTQDFTFPNGFTIPKGQEVISNGFTGLGIGVVLWEATVPSCNYPDLELEVEIFPVPTEIGLSVQPECRLWFFIDLQDFYTEAPLE